MAISEHLIIKTEGLPIESLLSDWGWLVKPGFIPIVMTAFGDLFLRDETAHVHFLDLMSGEFKQVADSQEEFDRLCEDREHRRIWFIGSLVMELQNLLGKLSTGQCYSCKIPPSLGGKLEPENFERADLEVHYSVLGQLHQQTKHLPRGTKIESIKIDSPHAAAPKSWWKKLFICL
jgi:hypothetical protein